MFEMSSHLLEGQLYMLRSLLALPASALLPGLLQEVLGAQLQPAPPLLLLLLTSALTGGHQASSLLREGVLSWA